MSEESANPQAGVKRLVQFVVALVAVVLLYQVVMWGVRVYSSSVIESVEGKRLPAFELTDLDGQVVTDRTFAGRTAVLHFFRSRCPNCDAEAADIRRFAASLDPSKVALVGVMVDRVQGFPESMTAATLKRHAFEHQIVMADQAFVDAFHGVGWSQITPITYVADPKGVIVRSFRHPYTLEELRSVLP